MREMEFAKDLLFKQIDAICALSSKYSSEDIKKLLDDLSKGDTSEILKYKELEMTGLFPENDADGKNSQMERLFAMTKIKRKDLNKRIQNITPEYIKGDKKASKSYKKLQKLINDKLLASYTKIKELKDKNLTDSKQTTQEKVEESVRYMTTNNLIHDMTRGLSSLDRLLMGKEKVRPEKVSKTPEAEEEAAKEAEKETKEAEAGDDEDEREGE